MPGFGRAGIQDLRREASKQAVSNVESGKAENVEVPSWAKQYEGVAEGYRQAAEKNQQDKIAKAKSNGQDTTDLEAGLDRLQKASPTYYSDLSDEDLVAKRNASEGEERQKYQDEINKRDSDGNVHSWTQADKDLSAKRQEEANKAETETKTEEAPIESKDDLEDKVEDIVEDSGEGVSGDGSAGANSPTEKAKEGFFKTLWNKLKEQDPEKQKEFLDKNPSMLGAIFGDSGLSFWQRAARLGEVLATISGAALQGTAAGFRGTSAPTVKPGAYASYYNKALEKKLDRQEENLDSANKAKNDASEKVSFMKNHPDLEGLSDNTYKRLASAMTSGVSKEGFAKMVASDLDNMNLSDEERKAWVDRAYTAFRNQTTNSDTVANQQEKQLSMKEKRTAIKTNLTSAIAQYEKAAADCEAMISKLTISNYKDIIGVSNDIVGMSKGLMAQNDTEGSSSNWQAATDVKGGIPVIRGSVSASGGHQWQDSTGKTYDLLGIKALEVAQQKAGQLERATQADVDSAKEALRDAAENYRQLAETLKAEMSAYQDKYAGVDDGVIKGRGVAQKIVRSDGSEVKLNPDDNVYATTNDIEPESGCDGEVTPMDEDEGLKYQERLGYKKGSVITKDGDYYANILKGGKK